MRTWVVPATFSIVAAAATVGLAGCAHQITTPPASMKDLVFLTREGCTNTGIMRARLDAALVEMKQPTDYVVLDLAKVAGSDPRSAYSTPTLLYGGRDVFGMGEPARSPHPEPT